MCVCVCVCVHAHACIISYNNSMRWEYVIIIRRINYLFLGNSITANL